MNRINFDCLYIVESAVEKQSINFARSRWCPISVMMSQITVNSAVCTTSYSCLQQRKQQAFRKTGPLWVETTRLVFSTYSASSHYLNQCCVSVNWTLRNKLQGHFNQNTKFFVHQNASESTWRPFGPWGDKLKHFHVTRWSWRYAISTTNGT